MKKGNLKTATVIVLLATLAMFVAPVYAQPKTKTGNLHTMSVVSGEGEIVTQFKAMKMIWQPVIDIPMEYYTDFGSMPWVEIEGASWITYDYFVDNPTDDSWYIYKKTFDIPGNVVEATMSITADNAYMLHVNGRLIGRDGNTYQPTPLLDPLNWQTIETYDITKTLREGDNKVVVYLRNYCRNDPSIQTNPTGLVFSIEISYLGLE